MTDTNLVRRLTTILALGVVGMDIGGLDDAQTTAVSQYLQLTAGVRRGGCQWPEGHRHQSVGQTPQPALCKPAAIAVVPIAIKAIGPFRVAPG